MQVTVEALSKVYPDGTEALHEVDLVIEPGECVVILGANGCGKSTLMRCILGIEPISSGRVLTDKIDIATARTRQLRLLRRRMGVVFQQCNLVNNLSAFQNVLFGRLGRDGLRGSLSLTASKAAREQAMVCLNRVGLASKATHRIDQLSGGQQQRAAIARMLMQEPDIVFADEPVASLDPKAGREVMDLLWDVVQERGITVVCVLHQIELARAYASRLVGLRAGRICMDGQPADISAAQLQDLYLAAPAGKPASQLRCA